MKIIISFLVCLFIFFAIPQAGAHEESYNFWALKYLKQGIESLTKGDFQDVITQCNLVLRIDPESSVTYTIRARAYFELGYMDHAIADCTQALRHDRNNLSAYSLRANAYALSGVLDRAITDWNAVLRIDPENEIARQNMEIALKTD